MFDLLGLSELKYLGRKLSKKMFYENGDLSKNDKKLFVDYIDKIEMSYMINSSVLNIQPFVNENYHYEVIAYIKISLKEDGNLDNISKIINNAIPNPLIIIYELHNKYKISTAIKKLSNNNRNKTVIEESMTTPWLDINNLNENEKKFIKSISINNLPYTNLFDFYKTINDKIYIFEKSIDDEYRDISDKKELEEYKEIREQIESLENELKKTVKKLKKESQFARKLELNVKATNLKEKIEELKNKIQ